MDFTLIDTDILVDIGRDDPTAIRHVTKISHKSMPAICSVTQMELIVGCQTKAELIALRKFLKRFEIILLTENIAKKAVELLEEYRLSHGLSLPDSLIAATALEIGLEFSSKNQKDYRFLKGLKLLPYP